MALPQQLRGKQAREYTKKNLKLHQLTPAQTWTARHSSRTHPTAKSSSLPEWTLSAVFSAPGPTKSPPMSMTVRRTIQPSLLAYVEIHTIMEDSR